MTLTSSVWHCHDDRVESVAACRAALAEIADHRRDHVTDESGLLTSPVAGLLWRWLFNTDIPGN